MYIVLLVFCLHSHGYLFDSLSLQLKKYSAVNRKALDQFLSFDKQREHLISRKEEMDTDGNAIQELIQSLGTYILLLIAVFDVLFLFHFKVCSSQQIFHRRLKFLMTHSLHLVSRSPSFLITIFLQIYSIFPPFFADAQKDEAILRTFRGVSRHFSEVFAELVPGGAGQLIMRTTMDQDQDAGNSKGKGGKGKKAVAAGE